MPAPDVIAAILHSSKAHLTWRGGDQFYPDRLVAPSGRVVIAGRFKREYLYELYVMSTGKHHFFDLNKQEDVEKMVIVLRKSIVLDTPRSHWIDE
jgi:hypothetical protein